MKDQKWCEFEGEAAVKDGVSALYFTFRGNGRLDFSSFILL